MVTWLPDRSEAAVRDALARVAPQLSDGRIVLHDAWVDTGNPLWSRSSAFVDDQWVVKLAWSEPAAVKLVRSTVAHEHIPTLRSAVPLFMSLLLLKDFR